MKISNPSPSLLFGGSIDTIVYTPISIPNTRIVNAFFATKLNGEIITKFFDGFKYNQYKFGNYTNLNEMTASKLAINIIKLDYYTCGSY